MCTSGVMYLDEEEYWEEIEERVCEYSGLLSVEQYQWIEDENTNTKTNKK